MVFLVFVLQDKRIRLARHRRLADNEDDDERNSQHRLHPVDTTSSVSPRRVRLSPTRRPRGNKVRAFDARLASSVENRDRSIARDRPLDRKLNREIRCTRDVFSNVPKRQSRRRALHQCRIISSATIIEPVVVTRRRRHDLQGDVVDCVRAAGRREIRTETTAATSANLFESVRRLRAQRTGGCG